MVTTLCKYLLMVSKRSWLESTTRLAEEAYYSVLELAGDVPAFWP